jgi:hypothetical protein
MVPREMREISLKDGSKIDGKATTQLPAVSGDGE